MADQNRTDHRPIPFFKKSVYSSNGTVVVTSAAREVMAKNQQFLTSRWGRRKSSAFDWTVNYQHLTKSEIHSMRSVVHGLRLIHRDQSHVKEVLAHCVTLESYGPHEFVTKKAHEQQLSCHFILSGSVKVVYEIHKHESSNNLLNESLDEHVDDATDNGENSIICNHEAGEYLAMLSLEGIDDGIAPPTKTYTLEPTELLRIDTKNFHDRLEHAISKLRDEIKSIVQNPRCILSAVPDDAVDRILPHITKQYYPPQHEVLKQDDTSNFMFCLAKGRCDVTRSVHIPEARKDIRFNLGNVEQYGIFGQECLLRSSPSVCTVTTTLPCMVLKINRLALEVVVKDHLFGILDKTFHGFPSDEALEQIGYHNCLWNEFKSTQVRQHLVEVGSNHALLHQTTERIRRRSLSKGQNYPENFRRFILKGAQFEPVTTRIRSAYLRCPKTQCRERPKSCNSNMYDVDNYQACIRGVTLPGNDRSWNKQEASHEEQIRTRSCKVTNEISSKSYVGHDNNILRSVVEDDDGVEGIFGKENDSIAKACEANATREEEKVPTNNTFRKHEAELPEKQSDTKYNSNFMRAAVMVTLKTNEIVKKAKAVVEKSRQKAPSHIEKVRDEDGVWYTSIHCERDRLNNEITTDKERMLKLRTLLDGRIKRKQEVEGDCVKGEEHTKYENEEDDNSKEKKITSRTQDYADYINDLPTEKDIEKSLKANAMTRKDDIGVGSESVSSLQLTTTDGKGFNNNEYNSARISESGLPYTGSYVIPKTVPPRQSFLNGSTKVMNPSFPRTQVDETSEPKTFKIGLASTNESGTQEKINAPIDRLGTSRTVLSQSDHETLLSRENGIMNAWSNEKRRTKAASSISSLVGPNHNTHENKPRKIIFRKGIRMRPVSAPVFNRKM